MIPGEMFIKAGEILLNEGRTAVALQVTNLGDRPVQVGSHFHFADVNPCLDFMRESARGMHLDIPSGTSVRFEPGEAKTVYLVQMQGEWGKEGDTCEP